MLLVSAYLYWNRIVIGFQAKTVSSSWSSLTLGFILYHLSLFSNRSHFGPTCELINYLVELGWFFFFKRNRVLFYLSYMFLFQSSPYTWKHLLHWFLHQLIILTSQESRGSPFIIYGWSPQCPPDRTRSGQAAETPSISRD